MLLDDLVSKKRGQSYPTNVWMGYGIDKRVLEAGILPLDMLPFILWGDRHAAQSGHRHMILIADDLAVYNGLDLEQARQAGAALRDMIRPIVERFDCASTTISVWREVADTDEYRDCRIAVDRVMKTKIDIWGHILETVPGYQPTHLRAAKELNDATHRAQYAVEEIAMTLHLARLGYGMKLGHAREQRYDKCTNRVLPHLSSNGIALKQSPTMTYLHGGYETTARTTDNVIAPYLLPNLADRVMMTETNEGLTSKLERSTSIHRTWVNRVLHLAGQNTELKGIPTDAMLAQICTGE